MSEQSPEFRSRRRMRAFDAGRAQRRLRSVPTSAQSINMQIRHYGPTVLARSRYLAANNSYASAAKETFVAALAGDGITPTSLLADDAQREELQAAFLQWTDEADADWLTDFYGLQSMIASEMFEAGECFVRIRSRAPEDGLSVPMQLQLIPAEMLPVNDNRDLRGGGESARVEMGIEFDAIGRRIAYHFLRRHPGSGRVALNPNETVRVPAEEILHLFQPKNAGQIRGIPHTISAIAKLAMLDQYDDAELERKRVAAMFGGFITREAPPAPEDGSPFPGLMGSGDEDEEEMFGERPGLEPGAFVDLNPGEGVEFSEPADVGGNYDVFQYRSLTSIASGFGVPYAAMTGDLRQTSYSSVRAGLVEFRRRITALQHHVMVYQFCRPVWQRWIREAVLAGAVPISPSEFVRNRAKFERVKWNPPRWEWVDPLKDLKAEQLAVQCGFKSRGDVTESMGFNPEDVDRRIQSDQEREDRLRLRLGPRTAAPETSETEEGEG